MKKMRIYYFILSTFLLVGCESFNEGLQEGWEKGKNKFTLTKAPKVIDQCNADNFGEYYGDCIFKTYESKSYKAEYLEKYNYRSDWIEISQINTNILDDLATEKISITEANELFMDKFDALYQKELQRLEKRDQALQDIADSFGKIGDRQSGRINNVGQGQTGYLEDEYISGFNKICIYSGIKGDFTKTISSQALCPLTAKQE
jgi:hypothetical protein